jgi:zinc D-Ala-D-Ala carboxypeptidase
MNDFLQSIYDELGITQDHLSQNKLAACKQAPLDELKVIEIDFEGRPFILHSTAARAWRQMQLAAQSDLIELKPFSGFRSYVYQKQLIRRKLNSGQLLASILTETAIPGFSEHHSGRAVDLYAGSNFNLNEDFERTEAFSWMTQNASRFNFTMSYPRDNVSGIIYEPWHWCFYEK